MLTTDPSPPRGRWITVVLPLPRGSTASWKDITKYSSCKYIQNEATYAIFLPDHYPAIMAERSRKILHTLSMQMKYTRRTCPAQGYTTYLLHSTSCTRVYCSHIPILKLSREYAISKHRCKLTFIH